MGSSIGNGMGRAIVIGHSLRDLEDVARSFGYDGIELVRHGREFRAVSYNAKGQRAEALGRNEVAAAQSLVRTLQR